MRTYTAEMAEFHTTPHPIRVKNTIEFPTHWKCNFPMNTHILFWLVC